jgi:hypothetical protein
MVLFVPMIFFLSMLFFQIIRVIYFKNPTEKNAYIWNWARILMCSCQVVSEIIVIYVFLEFSKPTTVQKKEKKKNSS